MADIESMFYQVIVPDCDSSFLRFLLWKDSDLVREYTSSDPFRHRLARIAHSVRQQKIISMAFLQASLTLLKGISKWMTVSSPSLPTLFSMLTAYESYFHVLVLR